MNESLKNKMCFCIWGLFLTNGERFEKLSNNTIIHGIVNYYNFQLFTNIVRSLNIYLIFGFRFVGQDILGPFGMQQD